MGVIHDFPYTNIGELNTDWVLKVVKEFYEKYNGIDAALDHAIETIVSQENISVEALNNLQTAIEEALAAIRATYLEELTANKNNGLAELNSKTQSGLTQLQTFVNTFPADAQEIVTSLNKLQEIVEIISQDIEGTALTPTILTTGYYDVTGMFHEEAGRKYMILQVQPDERYSITTALSSTAIAGVLFRNNDSVLSYDLRGTGTLEVITDYIVTIPDGCNNIIVQCASSTRNLAVKPVYTYPNNVVLQLDSVRWGLGPNLMAGKNGTLGTNWSGSAADGWTHTAGSNSSLSFYSADIETDAVYICQFDTNYTEDEFVNVGIGNNYRILVYTGETHITIPLAGNATKNLFFTPISNKTFTISNMSLRKLGGNDEYIAKNLYNVLTSNHRKTYGFWNILVGENNAENAVGSTRCIALGYAALNSLTGGHRNVVIGTFALSQMTGGENNVAIGADSMLAVKRANDCIAIGKGTAYNGVMREDDVAIGHYALTGNNESNNSKRNVAVGKSSGWKCYGQDNTFVGYQAGYNCENTNGNTMVGKNALGAASGNHNTAIGEQSGFGSGNSNSTAIGYNVQTTKSNQVKIGNANVEEFVLGNKKIIFNENGTVSWETV